MVIFRVFHNSFKKRRKQKQHKKVTAEAHCFIMIRTGQSPFSNAFWLISAWHPASSSSAVFPSYNSWGSPFGVRFLHM